MKMRYEMKRAYVTAGLAVALAFGGLHSTALAASAQDIAARPATENATEAKKASEVTVYVGDNPTFRMQSQKDYEALIQKLQKSFQTEGSEIVNFRLEPALSVKDSGAEEGDVKTVDEAFVLLTQGGREEALYVAEETESLESIAKRFKMTLDEIKALNENWEDPVTKGTKLVVLQPAPMIKAEIEEIATTVTDIPFATVTKEDPERFENQKTVEQAGVNGKMESRVLTTKVDGRIVSSVTEGSRMSAEPVAEVVLVGTKKGAQTNSFIHPAVGRLTSPYGPRWGRFHYGIDVANCVGTDIIASDGGVITRAGRAGTYGNLVEIDHQNGYKTRYAHLSRVDVKVGDMVGQGQSVGKMGSTGRSTGPHLHFEIIENGKNINPAIHVQY